MTAGHVALLLSAIVAAGCAAWSGPKAGGESSPARAALMEADRAAAEGRVRDAATRYEKIVRENPKDPVAADALHRLAMLRLERGPLRDRRAAQALLRRLATEYPRTLAGREALAWRGLLREIDRCEAEATKRGADAEKLRQTLDSIRDSDLELEQVP